MQQRLPCGSAGKESACSVGDLISTPGLGRSPGVGKGYPLQYSGLENSMDCIVHGVAKSRTRLSDFHFTSRHFTTTISIQLHPCLLHQNKTPYSSSSYSPSCLPPLPPLASGNHQSTSYLYRLTVSGYFTRQNYKYVIFVFDFT